MEPLTDDERTLLADLDGAAVAAAEQAGAGAWVERKPASVVLHVRQADDSAGTIALLELADIARGLDGATVKAGSGVLEAFARHTDKGTALMALTSDLGAVTTVFLGDDLTDEEAFAHLSPGDVAIKVGDAATIAPHRLRDPHAVLTFLQVLTNT
jgi:trehalose-phosphatase